MIQMKNIDAEKDNRLQVVREIKAILTGRKTGGPLKTLMKKLALWEKALSGDAETLMKLGSMCLNQDWDKLSKKH